MKLERLGENQIRCTLTKEDLEIRQIKISEISYGNAKAKMLFKDVMQQASFELGFEADNIPLMIEAIPMSSGCIVFIITKVDNPEELDTRFSRFSPSVIEEGLEEDGYDDMSEYDIDEDEEEQLPEKPQIGATARIEVVGSEALKDFIENISASEGNVFDLFKKITAAAAPKTDNSGKSSDDRFTPVRLYSFETLDNVGKACKVLNTFYGGESSLYKNTQDGTFYLLLERGNYNEKEFLKVSNMMLEYSSHIKTTPSTLAYIKEHYECMIESQAVQGMSMF